MKTIITIVEMPSMPGRFQFSLKVLSKRTVGGEAGHDCEAAAAKAMDLALHHGANGYCIFAPKKVLQIIPLELRAQ